MDIQRIKRIRIRNVWKHEAHDFTPWIEENIDVLNDDLAVELDPDSVQREASAGAFSVDLIAENANGETVIIENQLERSDHDHLGKVLTYAAAFEATTAIWIVGDPRPEHVKAVAWLNDSSQLTVYMFKIQAIQIGDSPVAPLLTLIVGPSESAKSVASSKKEKTDRHQARRAFYTDLLEYANTQTSLHESRSATDSAFLDGRSGQTGVNLTYGITQHETSIHLWIDKGRDWAEWNDSFYQYLFSHKEEIEGSYGVAIIWSAKEANRSRTLKGTVTLGGWVDRDSWPVVIKETVTKMIQFNAAIQPHLKNAAQAADKAVSNPSVDE
jgi:hypothetical protein